MYVDKTEQLVLKQGEGGTPEPDLTASTRSDRYRQPLHNTTTLTV